MGFHLRNLAFETAEQYLDTPYARFGAPLSLTLVQGPKAEEASRPARPSTGKTPVVAAGLGQRVPRIRFLSLNKALTR